MNDALQAILEAAWPMPERGDGVGGVPPIGPLLKPGNPTRR
jgi:hypothetical protein